MKKKNYSPGPIVLDVEALVLNEQDKARIAHPLTGGVILFGRNFQNRQQLTTLTKAIKAVREDVLIAIDHEGGRVQRCKTDGFTHLPAIRFVVEREAVASGQAYSTRNSLARHEGSNRRWLHISLRATRLWRGF